MLFNKLVSILTAEHKSVTIAKTEVFGRKRICLGQWVFYDDFNGVEIRHKDGSFRTQCSTIADLYRILACLNFD